MKNEIYLRRKNSIVIEKMENELDKRILSTMIKNISSLGYIFSKEVIEVLETFDSQSAFDFYNETVANIKKMLGADVEYEPMYPNFPAQVMEADVFELYFNAIIHYLSFGVLMPEYEKEERSPLFEDTNIKVIELGSNKDFNKIFINILNSKTSISTTDRKDLEWFIANDAKNIFNIMPDTIPLKENVALFSRLIIKNTGKPQDYLTKYYNTATDVLRFAVEMSEGDISLATACKFRKFSKKERRMILGLLEKCGNIEEDMLRYKGRWIRLGEIIHPSQYKTRFPKSEKAFYKLRNGVKIETFNSKVDKLIANKEYTKLIELLSTRAGEFARRLDYTLRLVDDKVEVINAFKQVVTIVSTPVLLQVENHFKTRNSGSDLRIFFPKGLDSKAMVIKNELAPIEQQYCDYITTFCNTALKTRYMQTGEVLGKVFIEEGMKNFVVPFSQRSASEGAKILTRGSRIPLNKNAKVVRAFCYWKNLSDKTEYNSRVDIDLSATMYDENWNYKGHVSYTNLKDSAFRACHSGDITNAPNGASEFIDIDLGSFSEHGGRYVSVNLFSYSRQPFAEISTAFMGWMEREDVKSGEIYETSTVKQKIDLTMNSTVAMPLVIDTVKKEIIWMDLSTKGSEYRGGNNLESNFDRTTLVCKSITDMTKPNLYDLFMLHAETKGFLVEDREEADTVFAEDGDITPYDIDVIMGEYL